MASPKQADRGVSRVGQMRHGRRTLRTAVVSFTAGILLPACAVLFPECALVRPAEAKPVTYHDIKVDVPDTFEASDYKRGMEVKTPDDEVYVWFETSKGSERQALLDEHNAFWKDNDVSLNDPVVETATQKSGTKQQTLDFKSATWKGKPTVIRYVFIGPLGSADTMIVYTLWASPEGFQAHSAEIQGMLQSMDARVEK